MKAIILAGGLGTRLELKNIPKPMYKILDKPILEHNILLLKKYEIDDICVAIHHFPDAIKDYFGDGKKFGVKICYSFEKQPLGTSGAVKNAQWFIDDNNPFFVIYGDNFTNINLREMLQNYKSASSLVQIAVFDRNKSQNSGIAGGFVKIDEDNNIISFIEKSGNENQNGKNNYVNAGVYVLDPKIFGIIPKEKPSDFGKEIFPALLRKKSKLQAYIMMKGFVIAIDTKEALQKTEKLLQDGEIQ